MAEEDYKLWCICENDKNAFRISISPTKDIYDLKGLIVKEQFFGKYSAADLTLTKVRHIMISMRHYDLITSRRSMWITLRALF